MISIRIIQYTLICLLLLPQLLSGQDNRTVNTRVADILALLPADDAEQANKLFRELMSLGNNGLQVLTEGVQHGMPAATGYVHAIDLLTHYVTSKEDKASLEQVYINALGQTDNNGVKGYFINNLTLVGSDKAVEALVPYLDDKVLFEQAVAALVFIATPKAKQVLTDALKKETPALQERLIKALGILQHQPSLLSIAPFVSSNDVQIRNQALMAMACMADPGSADILIQQAETARFKHDETEATEALIRYMNEIGKKGNNAIVTRVSKVVLDNALDVSQKHFRLAALKSYVRVNGDASVKILIKERNRFDTGYRKDVLNIAAPMAGSESVAKRWLKECKRASGEAQAEILSMLAGANRNDGFRERYLVPALTSKSKAVRTAAVEGLGHSRNEKFTARLADHLLVSVDSAEVAVIKTALLQLLQEEKLGSLVDKIDLATPQGKAAILQILEEKRAGEYFDVVAGHIASHDPVVQDAAYHALAAVSDNKDTGALLSILMRSEKANHIIAVQSALAAIMQDEGADARTESLFAEAYEKDKIKIIPLLPYGKDKESLNKVVAAFEHGDTGEKEVAFEALTNWQDHAALRTLLKIRKDQSLKAFHERALSAYVGQVVRSSLPDDQKLLMLREGLTVASGKAEKSAIIAAAGRVRTFLSLMFVSNHLDDPELYPAASRAAMQIALPTSDARPGFSGVEVRNVLHKILDKLTGPESQYERIDIMTYLEKMPYTKGFEPIFNGKDLTGWQGLVENPVARSKMSKGALEKKQREADAKISNSWTVKDGAIWFTGDGNNLCTVRPYGDFEMLVDWKISRNGDSGIYLRGSPQVQIWDISNVTVGAQVGSGGLYNNEKERSKPLVVADNPVGEWNTFCIKMAGDHVTVHLNGVLVVDSVVMENYWDRSIPIFPEGAIELQAHGTELGFRNIYVKELGSKPYQLTDEESAQGYEVLFNGKDLNNWTGNKTEYVVEDNTIAIYPAKKSHGNLYSEKEYADFVFRFEFQLTQGANNGLGIHAPLEGDAAYVGKEIQILDNEASVYAKLEPYQYHGSVYGIMAAKRGYLKPVGEWNTEEVMVKGDYIKVTLNGTVILEGDIKKASKNGTLDKKDHPGLKRNKGHIAFLGHGSVVRFRNLRIKDLSK